MGAPLWNQSLSGTGVAAKVAAEYADTVDCEGRFPSEALDAVRSAKLLSVSLPRELGGGGASVSELAATCRMLGRACSSTAMIFAMHHSQALCLRFHSSSDPGTQSLIEDIVTGEKLIASATTEITTGGDVGSSTCAVVRDGDQVSLEKNAPVISYGKYADYIFATARKNSDSPSTDQVMLACPAEDTELEPTSEWHTLGLRGTCSPGFVLRARTSVTNLLPVDYATISSHTMLPACHVLWASVWLGIADAAMEKARAQVRKTARRTPIGAGARVGDI